MCVWIPKMKKQNDEHLINCFKSDSSAGSQTKMLFFRVYNVYII